jgi:hemerythrin-like metal-binding protein
MKIEWTEEYSVKVKEFDEQHKQLFELMIKFDDAIKQEGLRARCENIIEEMNKYTVYHFRAEEKYFNKLKYPQSKEHKKKHDEYKVLAVQYKKQLNSTIADDDLLDFAYKILDFLEDWWVHHILHEDMKYSKFFNDKGLN